MLISNYLLKARRKHVNSLIQKLDWTRWSAIDQRMSSFPAGHGAWRLATSMVKSGKRKPSGLVSLPSRIKPCRRIELLHDILSFTNHALSVIEPAQIRVRTRQV